MTDLDAAGLTLRVYQLVEEHAGGDVEQAARSLGVAHRVSIASGST